MFLMGKDGNLVGLRSHDHALSGLVDESWCSGGGKGVVEDLPCGQKCKFRIDDDPFAFFIHVQSDG